MQELWRKFWAGWATGHGFSDPNVFVPLGVVSTILFVLGIVIWAFDSPDLKEIREELPAEHPIQLTVDQQGVLTLKAFRSTFDPEWTSFELNRYLDMLVGLSILISFEGEVKNVLAGAEEGTCWATLHVEENVDTLILKEVPCTLKRKQFVRGKGTWVHVPEARRFHYQSLENVQLE